MTTSTPATPPPQQAPTTASKAVFVVGYMHSGTTLLYKMLGQHPSLFGSKGETKYFELMPMLRRRFPDLESEMALRELVEYTVRNIIDGFAMSELSGGARPAHELSLSSDELEDLVEQASGSRDYGDVFRIVFDQLARSAGKPRWIEKTPTHVFHIDKILAAVPDARFIEITRDPRDVLASKKTRRADVWTSRRYTEEQRQRKHLEKAFDPLWDALSWKSAVTAGRNARKAYPDRFFHVRYEDLVREPEKKLRDICAFLELDYDARMMDVPAGNSAEWSPGRGDGVHTASLKRWRKTLSAAELALSQGVLRTDLIELGYELDPTPPAAYVEAIALLWKSLAELVARVVRRWRMGGTSYLLNVIRDYGDRFAVLATAKR